MTTEQETERTWDDVEAELARLLDIKHVCVWRKGRWFVLAYMPQGKRALRCEPCTPDEAWPWLDRVAAILRGDP